MIRGPARSEIWTISGNDYAGKPRPALIIQSDKYSRADSISLIPLTADINNASHLRIDLPPDEINGLRLPSQLMVDKITTIPKSKLGRKVGFVNQETMAAVAQALKMFLELDELEKTTH
jgi:mRNA interferase MazF